MAYDLWQSCMLLPVDFKRSDCASWVQAWGSISAIAFAILIAYWQIRHSRALAKAERNKKALVMLEAVRTFVDLYAREIGAIAAMIDSSNSAVQSDFLLRIDPEAQFESTERSARAIPLHDLPDAAAVRLVVELMNHIRTDRNAIANLKLALKSGELAQAPRLYSLKGHVQAARRLLQKADAAIERLAAD